MKLIPVIILVGLLSLCACGQSLRIMWNPSDNADADGVEYYTVYKWEGDSTQWQNWQLSQMDSIGILPHVMNFDGPYEFRTYFNETLIIQGGVRAVDSLGRTSEIALSRFYFHPSEVDAIWVGK